MGNNFHYGYSNSKQTTSWTEGGKEVYVRVSAIHLLSSLRSKNVKFSQRNNDRDGKECICYPDHYQIVLELNLKIEFRVTHS
jgi:hypothetical protein